MNSKIKRLLKNQGGNYIFPFFWQHGETEEVLREYMKVIDESNIKAVCVESRPHPDFCGEKWWKDMDVILDEAKKRNMKVWILDDSHFPTGFANGAMADQPDELCRQSICCRTYDLAGVKNVHISRKEICHPEEFQKTMIENYTMQEEQRHFDDDRRLAVFAVRQDHAENGFVNPGYRINLEPFITEAGLDWEVPAGKWKIYALHLSRNFGYHRSYINMMDRASCKVLLDAVYEPHYAHYKDEFGTTIAGFFSDEPELGNGHMYNMDDPFGSPNDYPWSRELEEKLKVKLGDDYGILLALLWEKDGDACVTAKVRYAFMDAVTELVRDDFSWQIGNWCRERGVKYIGHLIEDDNHHTRTGSSLGHFFRGLAGQDMSGIDDIGGQVFPQGEDISYNEGLFQHRNGEFYHYMLGKLGSSAAAIEPLKKGDSMCEIFGNYGWSEGVRLEKYLADHFLVRGINNYVPHAFSAKAFPDPDCPPHFYAHGHNPQYRHFGSLMAYMNRVCELISGGKHIAPAAVIYHAEGDWTGEHMTADKIGHVLADAQIEYDYIPQDVFSDMDTYGSRIEENLFRVNTQEYKVVIVPYMQYVTKAFARALREMKEKGIQVIFVNEPPHGICDTSIAEQEADREIAEKMRDCGKAAELGALAASLENIPEIMLVPADNRIRYIHYVHEDGSEVWLFVNEGTDTYKGEIRIHNMANEGDRKEAAVYLYDAWENCLEAADYRKGVLKLEIEPLKSRIFIMDGTETPEDMKAEKAMCTKKSPVFLVENKVEKTFSSGWERSTCRSIDYPAFENKKAVILPDHLAEEEPEFSGFVRYENTFMAAKMERMYLEITDAYEGVEVFVNDKSLGIQIVPVYRYDLTEALREGENHIRIEVATTLEREMANVPTSFGQIAEAKSLSGITGDVRLWSIE